MLECNQKSLPGSQVLSPYCLAQKELTAQHLMVVKLSKLSRVLMWGPVRSRLFGGRCLSWLVYCVVKNYFCALYGIGGSRAVIGVVGCVCFSVARASETFVCLRSQLRVSTR